MGKKIFFAIILVASFLLASALPLVQASLIGNAWYNALVFLGIIEITNANHLNSDRVVISDIYNEVNALDGVWSETIPDRDYLRATFEKNLTKENDITIYPRIVSGNPKIEIYEKDKAEKIAEFTSLNSNEYNKIYLTNLQGSQDVFDLKILDGSVEFDYIVDPFVPITYSGFEAGAQGWTFAAQAADSFRNTTKSYWLDTGALGGSASAFVRHIGRFNNTFDFTGYTNVTMKFSHFASGIDSGEYYSMFCDTREIIRCTEGTGTSVNIVCTGTAQKAQFVWHNETLTLYPVNCTFDNSVLINFIGVANNDVDNFHIDGINITGYDSTKPIITVASPTNGSTQSTTVDFNVSLNEAGSWCGFSLDHTANITMTAFNTTYFNFTNSTMTVGNHNITFSCNDTAGNMNASSGITYFKTSLDTCTCAGLNNDWEIDLSDYCILDDDCELGTGTLNFTGIGNATCSANINTTNLGNPGANGIMYVKSDCYILVR